MIIASSAKKEISIPLQPMTSVSSSNNIYSVEETAPVDLVTVNSRNKGNILYSFLIIAKPNIFAFVLSQAQMTLSFKCLVKQAYLIFK